MKGFLKDERGIALILVLWVMVLLTVIAGEFSHTIGTEVEITRNFKEETQAYYIAKAGMFWMIGELVANTYLPHPGFFKGNEDTADDLRWRLTYDMPAIPFGEGQFQVRKENESGKVNLNLAGRGLLRMMLNDFEIEDAEKEIIVDSIMDWRDQNGLTHTNGAENEYYQSLPEPYRCKNGDFTTIEELLLVRGVTPGIFYGGLREMVSVCQDADDSIKAGSKRKAMVDFNRININAASARMLRSLPGMTEDSVEAVLAFRDKRNFRSRSELYTAVGPETYRAISTYMTMKPSPYYTLQSTGLARENQAQKGVRAVVKIDRKLEKGYEIIQWVDGLEY